VDYFKHEGLSLSMSDFSKMLEGIVAAAETRTKKSSQNVIPTPVRSIASNNLFTAQEGFLFNALLNEAAKLPDGEAKGVRKELLQRLSVALGDEALHNARREVMRSYLKDIKEERRKREELEREAECKRNELADSFDNIIAQVLAMQGKLKATAHSVMIQHSLISSWRG